MNEFLTTPQLKMYWLLDVGHMDKHTRQTSMNTDGTDKFYPSNGT